MSCNAAGNKLEIQKNRTYSPILHYFRTYKIISNRYIFEILSALSSLKELRLKRFLQHPTEKN